LAHPEELPQSYQEQLEEEKPARVVCDYIAGMTDNFILREYERLCVEGGNQQSAISSQPSH
jgi:dGTPase